MRFSHVKNTYIIDLLTNTLSLEFKSRKIYAIISSFTSVFTWIDEGKTGLPKNSLHRV